MRKAGSAKIRLPGGCTRARAAYTMRWSVSRLTLTSAGEQRHEARKRSSGYVASRVPGRRRGGGRRVGDDVTRCCVARCVFDAALFCTIVPPDRHRLGVSARRRNSWPAATLRLRPQGGVNHSPRTGVPFASLGENHRAEGLAARIGFSGQDSGFRTSENR